MDPKLITATSLYYFFSTVAQAYAALLAVLLTVYGYLESIYYNEGIRIADANEKIISAVDVSIHVGSLDDAVGKARTFVMSGERTAGDARRDRVTRNLTRLEFCAKRLTSARGIPAQMPYLLAMICAFSILTPFAEGLASSQGSAYAAVAVGVAAIVASGISLGRVLLLMLDPGGSGEASKLT